MSRKNNGRAITDKRQQRNSRANSSHPLFNKNMSPSRIDDQSCSSDDLSVDSDVAFAFVDFTGVNFGDDEPKKVAPKDCPLVAPATVVKEQVPQNTASKLKQQQPIEMPNGQELQQRPIHDGELFKAQQRRVENLCKWYELGSRPSMKAKDVLNIAAHKDKDEDLFAEKDDLNKLLLCSIEAQDDLNTNLPPHPLGKYEDNLEIAPSTIEGAGNGLFTKVPIPKGEVVCFYTGCRHTYQSQKRLKNRAYVLKLQNGWPKHDRKNDGFIDALPTKDVLARYINDARSEEKCSVKFENIQEPGIWYCPVVAQRDIAEGEELFVSYGTRYWSESRMIGG